VGFLEVLAELVAQVAQRPLRAIHHAPHEHVGGVADPAHTDSFAASTLQGTVFTDAALTNVATFFGLNGSIDLGTFDGAPAGGASWTPGEQREGSNDPLEHGPEALQQKLHAAEQPSPTTESSTNGAADWEMLAPQPAAAQPQMQAAAVEEVTRAPKIDWRGVLASFGAPLFTRVGSAKPAPNITEFRTPLPGKDER
jgi:hypothetical protein